MRANREPRTLTPRRSQAVLATSCPGGCDGGKARLEPAPHRGPGHRCGPHLDRRQHPPGWAWQWLSSHPATLRQPRELGDCRARPMGHPCCPHPEPRARRYKCGLPQPCPEEHLAFRMVSGAANVIGPKICLEDKMLMSSVKDNVGRGLNIALVNGVSGELIEARAFDMWAGDVNDLLKFIRPLHEGTLVFVASYDDPATKMNEETRKLFSDLGSKNVKDLAFRDSWVFVGAKGVQNKSPFEQVPEESLAPLLPGPGWSARPFCLHSLSPPSVPASAFPEFHQHPQGQPWPPRCLYRKGSNFHLPCSVWISP
ncbi:protein FAM3A isoform X1 [Camelus ferus]|uniref:Protein FAM3A isoform X1 n=1 Tax=Camelus ferus TaxID=419612 RepID=A0A8B8SLJ2_CAMFR|nr:protein FAM3A isoform X1 [Camelus ferus]